jgi:hypothetical protein
MKFPLDACQIIQDLMQKEYATIFFFLTRFHLINLSFLPCSSSYTVFSHLLKYGGVILFFWFIVSPTPKISEKRAILYLINLYLDSELFAPQFKRIFLQFFPPFLIDMWKQSPEMVITFMNSVGKEEREKEARKDIDESFISFLSPL